MKFAVSALALPVELGPISQEVGGLKYQGPVRHPFPFGPTSQEVGESNHRSMPNQRGLLYVPPVTNNGHGLGHGVGKKRTGWAVCINPKGRAPGWETRPVQDEIHSDDGQDRALQRGSFRQIRWKNIACPACAGVSVCGILMQRPLEGCDARSACIALTGICALRKHACRAGKVSGARPLAQRK